MKVRGRVLVGIVTADGRRGGARVTYRRTVCGVEFGDLRISDCVEEPTGPTWSRA